MTRPLTPLLTALLLAAAPMTYAAQPAGTAASAAAEEKIVYHINDSAVARRALANVANHLNASPNARIVVVTHGRGIDFLLNDAGDERGEFAPAVAGLTERGVDFRVCRNTLRDRNLDDDAVIMEANVVQSGVAEVGRLQAREGYAYLKP